MRHMTFALALAVLVGCSSVDSRLYEEGEPPRLIDGTVRLTTHWSPGRDDPQDVRIVRSRDGKVTCTYISHEHGHFLGDIPTKEWVSLWRLIFEAKPFDRDRMKAEPPDARGGPYHVISLQLGMKSSSFSAQYRQNLLVFSSRDVMHRMRFSNGIIKFVSRHAVKPLDGDLEKPAAQPDKKGDGDRSP